MGRPKRQGPWRGLLALLLFLLAVAAPAQAYIDPGTMSLVGQAVAGAFFGFLFALKMFWRRIRMGLARMFGRKKAEEEAAKEPSPPGPSEGPKNPGA